MVTCRLPTAKQVHAAAYVLVMEASKHGCSFSSAISSVSLASEGVCVVGVALSNYVRRICLVMQKGEVEQPVGGRQFALMSSRFPILMAAHSKCCFLLQSDRAGLSNKSQIISIYQAAIPKAKVSGNTGQLANAFASALAEVVGVQGKPC